MAGLHPSPGAGKVNGLQRPTRFRGRRLRIPARAPLSLIAGGVALYGIALSFPVLLRQVSLFVFAAAILGTVLLLVGLHVRWTREDPLAH